MSTKVLLKFAQRQFKAAVEERFEEKYVSGSAELPNFGSVELLRVIVGPGLTNSHRSHRQWHPSSSIYPQRSWISYSPSYI
jgi:hypothetical protein